METISALLIAGFGLSAHASNLTGPVVDPANGHLYETRAKREKWSANTSEVVVPG